MPAITTQAAVYCRGTIAGADAQHRASVLASLAKRRGWLVAATFVDDDGHRPQLKALQAAVMAGTVHAVLVTDVAELGAGVTDIVETLARLTDQGVALVATSPPLDSTRTEGKVMLRLAQHLAEHQADIRRERQRSSKRKKPAGGPRRKPMQ
jgi:DNA invertase Pin-like site-specific DNA recombinase